MIQRKENFKKKKYWTKYFYLSAISRKFYLNLRLFYLQIIFDFYKNKRLDSLRRGIILYTLIFISLLKIFLKSLEILFQGLKMEKYWNQTF